MEKGMKWNIVEDQIMVKFMSIVCSEIENVLARNLAQNI